MEQKVIKLHTPEKYEANQKEIQEFKTEIHKNGYVYVECTKEFQNIVKSLQEEANKIFNLTQEEKDKLITPTEEKEIKYFTSTSYINKKHREMNYLRLIHYYYEDKTPAAVCPVHCDLGIIKFATCFDEGVFIPQFQTNQWVSVEKNSPTKPCVVLFIGETLSRVTGAYLKAPLHKVFTNKDRLSIIFFLRGQDDSDLDFLLDNIDKEDKELLKSCTIRVINLFSLNTPGKVKTYGYNIKSISAKTCNLFKKFMDFKQSQEYKSNHARENTKSLFQFFGIEQGQNIFNDFVKFQDSFREPEHEKWLIKAKDQPHLWTGVMNYFGVQSLKNAEKDMMNLGDHLDGEKIIERMVLHIFSHYDLDNDGYLNPDEFTTFMWDSAKHYKQNDVTLKEIQRIYEKVKHKDKGVSFVNFTKYYVENQPHIQE
eukprot:gene11964-5365_t